MDKKCKFDLAWISQGCQEVADSTGFCEKHKKETCWKCGKQADSQCDDTPGSFVCGVSQCKKHPHGLRNEKPVWDWEKAKERNNEHVLKFLKEIQGLPMTEEKFIEEFSKLRKFSRGSHPAKKYSPSRGRMQYKILKEKFGFFK